MTSTTKANYWSILGLRPGSNIKEIKTAFRTEARRWHPDLNLNDANAEERFKLINEAYAVLSDPKKRVNWESTQSINTTELFSSGFPTYHEYVDIVLGISVDEVQEKYNSNDNNFEDQEIYYDAKSQNNDSDFSNNKPATSEYQPPPVKQSETLETLIELTPDQALNGTSVEIELSNGIAVEFKTPPFAGDGWRLRLPGAVVGGSDHFIQVRVQTEEGLRIDGLRVLYKLELFPHDALFGCGVEVPTLDGPVILQVPPRSSSGRLLRLKGRGLVFDDLVGDQIVEIVLVIPDELSDSELALYKRLQELSYEDNSN